MNEKKINRIRFVDGLRGLAIVGMIFHHTLFDLSELYNVDIGILTNKWFLGLLTFGAGIFIFLSGISSQFSKRNLRRGIEIFLFGMALTILTRIFLPREVIYFGILHFLGLSIIVYSLLKSALDRINQFAVFLVGITLFAIAYYIDSLNINANFFLSFVIGFPSAEFFSSDYFPMLPWFFLFIAGTGFGWYVTNRRLPEPIYKIKMPGFEFVGRNTMWIYLLHQPVILALLWVINLFI